MAKRRMFSIEIVETDRFTDLPQSAQCLYFHLAMTADDDGFVASARRIVKNIGASQDDLQLLIDGGFLIDFPEVSVYVIADFLQQNEIRRDRYHPTIYLEQKRQLTLTENRKYVRQDCAVRPQANKKTTGNCHQDTNQPTTNRQPDDNHLVTNRQPDGNQLTPSRQPDGPPVQSNSGEGSTDDDDMAADEAEIVETYQQEIGRPPMPGELSQIMARIKAMGFGPGVAGFATQLAASHGARNITAYIKKVLNNWDLHGLKTLSAVQQAYISGLLKPEPKAKNYDLPE